MVTSAPIPFVTLPRQVGTGPVDSVAASARLATAVDAQFAAINTWSNTVALSIRKVSGTAVFTPAINWTSTVAVGMAIGDARLLSMALTYTGPTLTGDAYGGVADQLMGTLDPDWGCPEHLIVFAGALSVGCAVFYISGTNLYFAGGSYPKVSVAANATFAFSGMYVRRT